MEPKHLDKPIVDAEEAIVYLRDALKTIRFGSVEFIIHEGRVLQVDRKEKLRVDPLAADSRKRQRGDR
jgi:hypothetical protein